MKQERHTRKNTGPSSTTAIQPLRLFGGEIFPRSSCLSDNNRNAHLPCPLPLFVIAYIVLSHDTTNLDATDEEQSSDDEAPEEVSAAAATALAGSRRKAEHLARQAAPKRKRARTSSSKGGKNAPNGEADGSGGGGGVEVGSGHNAGELGLPSELLLKVKSGGLQRIEADVLAAKELEKRQSGKTGSSTAIVGVRKADLPRRYEIKYSYCSSIQNCYVQNLNFTLRQDNAVYSNCCRWVDVSTGA